MYMSTHCNNERSCDLHCLASDVQQRFNVEIVGSQDDLKEHFLVDIDEFGVPIANLGGTLSGLFRFIGRGRRIAAVMGAIFQYLEDVRSPMQDGNTPTPENRDEGQRASLLLKQCFFHSLLRIRTIRGHDNRSVKLRARPCVATD